MSDGGRRRIPVSGGRLAVLEAGHPDAPAVVLVHGYPTSSFLWRAFVPALASEMRVIAPDLLGAGDSDKPVGAALDAEAQAGYVRELLAALGVSRSAIVAHGDGGTVAQLLALDSGVDALVLIDAAAFGESAAAAIERAVPATDLEPAAVIREALRRGCARPERIAPNVAKEYARPYDGPDGAGALVRWARAAAAAPGASADELARIESPTLLLWGEDDPFVVADVAERLNERIETSSLALLPGCGHFLPEEAAPTIVPLVAQWLAGRYLGRIHSHAHGPVPVRVEPRRSGPER